MRMLPIETSSVPRSHKSIDGRLPIVTAGGVEANITVVKQIDSTTNGDARLLMKKRILAVAEAQKNGVGLGIDLRVKLDEKDKDVITLNIPGMKAIPIEPMSDGSYLSMKQRYPDLRKAAVDIMEKYEMHHAAQIASTTRQPSAYGARY
ncbi:hypothetical protein G6L37_01220 [Agrobacterium rubi]|nr:hypothetical protein [Agrobacterium rubi]NTF24012.1 hypothetical protein [Agrobacterium rubi]